jgi:transcriptional regulator with XRE-family HTH domain
VTATKSGGSKRRQSLVGGRYDDHAIGQRIERRRVARGMKQEELADILGINKASYSRKVRAQTPMWLGEISMIADALRAPIGWPFVTRAQLRTLLDSLGDEDGDDNQ